MAAEPRFRLPDRGKIEWLQLRDGARLRTFVLLHPAPVARMLLLPGRADFLEKWARTLADMHALGLAVAAFDWRGQGLSSGKPANGAGHIDRFETWLADLDSVFGWATDALGGPPVPLGHSMGGHLLLRWLVARPGAVPAAILTAPFCGHVQPVAASGGLGRLARLMVRLGRGEAYGPGQKPFGAYRMATGRMALLTSDPDQFADEGRWVAAEPRLATGGVSWGWLAAADASLRALGAARLDRCETAVLMLLAGRERLVSNAAAWRVARRLARCRVETLPDAAHEILRESDPVRRRALSLVADFAARRAP